MKQACVLMLYVHEPKTHVHGLPHLHQDRRSSSMAYRRMGIRDPADSGWTAIDDRKRDASYTYTFWPQALIGYSDYKSAGYMVSMQL
jgi:hypothetical protein